MIWNISFQNSRFSASKSKYTSYSKRRAEYRHNLSQIKQELAKFI